MSREESDETAGVISSGSALFANYLRKCNCWNMYNVVLLLLMLSGGQCIIIFSNPSPHNYWIALYHAPKTSILDYGHCTILFNKKLYYISAFFFYFLALYHISEYIVYVCRYTMINSCIAYFIWLFMRFMYCRGMLSLGVLLVARQLFVLYNMPNG